MCTNAFLFMVCLKATCCRSTAALLCYRCACLCPSLHSPACGHPKCLMCQTSSSSNTLKQHACHSHSPSFLAQPSTMTGRCRPMAMAPWLLQPVVQECTTMWRHKCHVAALCCVRKCGNQHCHFIYATKLVQLLLELVMQYCVRTRVLPRNSPRYNLCSCWPGGW